MQMASPNRETQDIRRKDPNTAKKGVIGKFETGHGYARLRGVGRVTCGAAVLHTPPDIVRNV